MTRISKRLPALALGAAAFLVPVLALAQGTGGFGDPAPTPTPAPTPAPVVAPAPAPVYTPEPTRSPAAAMQAEVDADPSSSPPTKFGSTGRAEGMTFGLGVNYILGGAELDRPDGASLRIRLASGLTFEPFVRLATHGQSTDFMDNESKNAQNEFIVGTNARIPLKSRGKVDLVAQVGGGLGVFVNDPDGDDNNTTTTTITIDYGLSLEYWFNHNWTLSFTARNRFVRYESIGEQSDNEAEASNTDVGLIWDPVVDLSLHLFF